MGAAVWGSSAARWQHRSPLGPTGRKMPIKKNIYLLFKVFCVAAFVGVPDSIPATRTPFRSLIPSVWDE